MTKGSVAVWKRKSIIYTHNVVGIWKRRTQNYIRTPYYSDADTSDSQFNNVRSTKSIQCFLAINFKESSFRRLNCLAKGIKSWPTAPKHLSIARFFCKGKIQVQQMKKFIRQQARYQKPQYFVEGFGFWRKDDQDLVFMKISSHCGQLKGEQFSIHWNQMINERGILKNSSETYIPHITCFYVQKGLGQEAVKKLQEGFQRYEIEAKQLDFHQSDRKSAGKELVKEQRKLRGVITYINQYQLLINQE